jgi:hypothetical protein
MLIRDTATGSQSMIDLDVFIQQNVEGYLLEDLKTLKEAPLPPGKRAGAVGYPLLMTAFAGIELFGALLSPHRFNTNHGRKYFCNFWKDHLYKNDPSRAAAGEVLYSLVRHGLAHVYVTKGEILVVKNAPALHLTIAVDRSLYVDAAQLADDMERWYTSKIKSVLKHNRTSIQARLDEIVNAYSEEAAPLLKGLQLPSAPAGTSYTVLSLTTTSSSSSRP